jgi:hypothetical protein
MSAPALISAQCFLLPRGLAEECLDAIRRNGRRDAELFIALTAVIDDESATVHFRRGLIPRQTAHTTPQGLLVTIEGEAIFELNRDCYEHGEVLAGQIHGHPGRAYHSGADDELAIVRLPGGLSIVVPDFASGQLSPGRWSVHQLGASGAWSAPRPGVKVELT